MKTGTKGIELIKSFEGCRLEAYKCPAGVWTIGYGHTGTVDGKKICSGMKISVAKATVLLKTDLEKFEKKVAKYKKYKWTQYEFDALVSFAYNHGTITDLTALGTRKKNVIARKLLAYNKARIKGVLTPLPGLTRRRKAEQALFTAE
jgi:GH24 family phage-related lysozyme (muramidase)